MSAQTETARNFIDKLLSSTPNVVFGKSDCPYTKKAREFLDSLKVDYTAIMLDEVQEGEAMKEYLKEKTGQSGVPNIFIAREHVGGCSDLISLYNNGALATLLGLSLDVAETEETTVVAQAVTVPETVEQATETVTVPETVEQTTETVPVAETVVEQATQTISPTEEVNQKLISDVKDIKLVSSDTQKPQTTQPNLNLIGEITLYDHLLAYFPARARLVLYEKMIPFKHVQIDIFNGDSLKREFVEMNHEAALPVLKQGDVVINQSKEICLLIDNLDGKPLGGDKVDRALVNIWVDRLACWNGNLYMAGKTHGGAKKILESLTRFKISVCKARAEEFPDLAEVYREKADALSYVYSETEIHQNEVEVEQILDDANATLSKTSYLAGEEYSLADLILTPLVYRVAVAGTDCLGNRPALKAWYSRIKMRPSYVKTFKGALVQKVPALAVLGALPAALLCKYGGKC